MPRWRTCLAFCATIPICLAIAPVFSGDSKFENLRRLSRTNPLIKLTNSNEFHKYLISLPRDYSALVLFTERRRTCPDCWHAKRNLEAIAQHYVKNLWKPRIFLFMIVQEEVPHLFLKFQIEKSPALFHIPPTGKLSGISIMENPEKRLLRLPEILKWMQNYEDLGFEINNVDGDYGSNTSSMMQNLTMLVAAAVLIYQRRKKILKFINTSEYVAHVVTAMAVALISGHVFNYVKSPAFKHGSHFFYPGRRYQFQIEAYVMSLIYMGLATGFIYVTEGRRQLLDGKKSSKKAHMISSIGTIVFAVSYWAWTQAAQAKNS